MVIGNVMRVRSVVYGRVTDREVTPSYRLAIIEPAVPPFTYSDTK